MTFARQFLIYGIAGAFSRLASFLLVPLYTRTLSQPEYGRLELALSVYMLAVLLIGLQGESAVARDYFLARRESREREIVWGALAMAAGGLVLTMGGAGIAILAGAPSYLAANAALMLGAAAFTQIMGIQLVVVRFDERPGLYALLSALDVIVTTASSFVLIVWMDLGLSGALAGLLLGKAVVVTLAWPIVIGLPRPADFSAARVRAMTAYSLPTMPAVLLNWLQTIGNRILWSVFFPLGAVALASVGMRIAAAFGLIAYAFRLAWEPFAFRLLDEADDARSAFSPMLGYVSFGALSLACAAMLGGPLLTALFAPPQYRAAATLVGIVMMSQVWIVVMLVTQMGIHGARVTSRITWAYIAGAMANLAVLALAAQVVGLTATAWGTLAGSMTTALWGAWFSNRHFKTGFSVRLLTVLAVVTLGIGEVVAKYPAWGDTLWPHPFAALAAACAIAVFWWAGMEPADRSGARRIALQQITAVRRPFRSGRATRGGRASGETGRDDP